MTKKFFTISDIKKSIPEEHWFPFLQMLEPAQLVQLLQQENVQEYEDGKKETLIGLLISLEEEKSSTCVEDELSTLTSRMQGLALDDKLIQAVFTDHPLVSNEMDTTTDEIDDELVSQDKRTGYFSGRLGEPHRAVKISGSGYGCLPATFFTYLLHNIPLPDNWTSQVSDASSSSSSYVDMKPEALVQEMLTYTQQQFSEIFIQAMERGRKDFHRRVGSEFNCTEDSFFEPATPLVPFLEALNLKKYSEVVNFFAEDGLLWFCDAHLVGFSLDQQDNQFMATSFMRLMTYVSTIRLAHNSIPPLSSEEIDALDFNKRLAGHHDVEAFSSLFNLKSYNNWRLPSTSETQSSRIKLTREYGTKTSSSQQIELLYTFGEVGHFDLLLPQAKCQTFYSALSSELCDAFITALQHQKQYRNSKFEKVVREFNDSPFSLAAFYQEKKNKRVKNVYTAQQKAAKLLRKGEGAVDLSLVSEWLFEISVEHRDNLHVFMKDMLHRYTAMIQHLHLIKTLFSLETVMIENHTSLRLTFFSKEQTELFGGILGECYGLRFARNATVSSKAITIHHEERKNLQATIDLLYHALPLPHFQTLLKKTLSAAELEVGPYREVLVLHSQPKKLFDPRSVLQATMSNMFTPSIFGEVSEQTSGVVASNIFNRAADKQAGEDPGTQAALLKFYSDKKRKNGDLKSDDEDEEKAKRVKPNLDDPMSDEEDESANATSNPSPSS